MEPPEIIELNNEIEYLDKELEQSNLRKKKIHLVNDQVGGWSNRVSNKLNEQLLGYSDPENRKRPLVQLFN